MSETAPDTSASLDHSHPFEPRNPLEWWGLCKTCNRAQASHAESAIQIRYRTKPTVHGDPALNGGEGEPEIVTHQIEGVDVRETSGAASRVYHVDNNSQGRHLPKTETGKLNRPIVRMAGELGDGEGHFGISNPSKKPRIDSIREGLEELDISYHHPESVYESPPVPDEIKPDLAAFHRELSAEAARIAEKYKFYPEPDYEVDIQLTTPARQFKIEVIKKPISDLGPFPEYDDDDDGN